MSDMTALTQTEERIARPRPDDEASRRVWDIAATVCDPDIPVITIEDLGVLRSASVVDGKPWWPSRRPTPGARAST